MTSQTVFVTGANRGIGLEFVRHYVSKGYEVFGTSRDSYESCTELSKLIPKENHIQLDVKSLNSADGLEKFKRPINILINNAGMLVRDTFDDFKAEDIIDQFKTNSLGPLLVTRYLLGNLNAGSKGIEELMKVVNITSRMGSIEDNSSGGYYGYRASKTALNMITKSLSVDLEPKGIKVVAIHPGYIRTDMTNGNGEMFPDEAVNRMVGVIESFTINGGFYHRDGHILPH